jgi:catechol 2,3-dioxygenase-like lactoylglutathione lyase family enzyme
MTAQHHVVAIVPARDMDVSEAFYRRLGFTVVSDYGDYRLMDDERGGRLHLNLTPGSRTTHSASTSMSRMWTPPLKRCVSSSSAPDRK